MSERPFGSLSPQEAQAKSVEARRRNKAQTSDLSDDEQIEAGLVKRAKTGDPNAVRELREWRKMMRATESLGSLNDDIIRLISENRGEEGLDILRELIEGDEPLYWRYDFEKNDAVVVPSTMEGASRCSCGGRGCGACGAMSGWYYGEHLKQIERQKASRNSGRAVSST
jgi:uncharacterized protein YjiS (DUF1127 family)